MIRSLSVGIEFSEETIRFSIVDRQLNRFQVRDLLQVSEWSSKPMSELKKRVAEFLARHKAAGCQAVLLLPRQETVMRQLVLPLDAEANLAKVVEYQLVNLLPSEDALVAYDYASFQQEGSPGNLRVSVFLVFRRFWIAILDLPGPWHSLGSSRAFRSGLCELLLGAGGALQNEDRLFLSGRNLRSSGCFGAAGLDLA